MNLTTSDFNGKTWFEAVLTCVLDIGKEFFSTQEAYAYANILSIAYPENNNVESKIRQTLQFLRDAKILQFLERGNYRLLALELTRDIGIDFDKFAVKETAIPNEPLNEIGDVDQHAFNTRPSRELVLDRVRNEKLGLAGEMVVICREKRLLTNAGREDLASLVEQVSKTKGDYIGYDILSFDFMGTQKWIEVKTTKGRQSTKFHISRNQIATSERNPERYQLHRLFEFDSSALTTKLYVLSGNMRSQLNLVPTDYLALPRS